MAVVMLRHTTPLVAPGICYGQTDLDVADSFDAEVAQILERVPQIAAIVTSPLQRCSMLAERIADRKNLRVESDDRLKEMDFGTWEGQPWSDIPRDELDAWANDFFQANPHGGESVQSLKRRVDSVVSERRQTVTPTLFVTHGGVIRAALAKGEKARDYQTEIGFGELVRLPETKQGNQ